MRQRTLVWIGIGMIVSSMLLGGVVFTGQGSDPGSLSRGERLLVADGGGDCPFRRCR